MPRLFVLPVWLKVMLITALLLGLLYGLVHMTVYLIPILILLGATLILTYVLLGPVDWVEERLCKMFPLLKSPKLPLQPRGLAILVVYLLFAFVIAVAAFKTIPPLTEQVKGFADELPEYTAKLEYNLLRIKPVGVWYKRLQKHQAKSSAQAPGLPKALFATPLKNMGSGWHYLVDVGSTTLTTVIYGLTMLVLVFYMLMDGTILRRGFVNLLPFKAQGKVAHYLSDIHQVLSTFIKMQLILAVMVGVYLYIIYSSLGVEYAFFLSVFYAVASIVPVIGPWLGTLPTLLVVALSENPMAVVPIIMFLSAFYLLKVYWLVPKLFRTRLEIHPVIMILTLLVCMRLGNLPGLLMAFPLASLICGTQQYLLERHAAEGQYQ